MTEKTYPPFQTSKAGPFVKAAVEFEGWTKLVWTRQKDEDIWTVVASKED